MNRDRSESSSDNDDSKHEKTTALQHNLTPQPCRQIAAGNLDIPLPLLAPLALLALGHGSIVVSIVVVVQAERVIVPWTTASPSVDTQLY